MSLTTYSLIEHPQKEEHNQHSKTSQLHPTKRNLYTTLIKNRINPKCKPKVTTRQTTINLPSTINQIYPEENISSKIPESTRICYMNVNGLYSNQNDKIMEISAQMIEHEIDIFGITETNTHWNNGNIFRMALQQIKKNNE